VGFWGGNGEGETFASIYAIRPNTARTEPAVMRIRFECSGLPMTRHTQRKREAITRHRDGPFPRR
jgi:hypothetical protein